MRMWPMLLMVASASTTAELEMRHTFESQLSFARNDLEDGKVDVQVFDNLLSTEIESFFDNGLRVFADVTARYEQTDSLEPGQPSQQSASKLNRRWLINDRAELELRELYIDGYVDDVFFRVGKQQTVWGQSDGLQVLDVVNPMRYREFISDQIEDRRIPLWTVNVELPVQEWMLQLVWIPDQSYHQYPEDDAEYAITSPKLTPVIDGSRRVALESEGAPHRYLKDADYGFRLTRFAAGWDLGLSYLNQTNNSRGVVQQVTEDTLSIRSSYVRTHVLGATFARALGSVSVRGELAYVSDAVPLRRPDPEPVTVSGSATQEFKAVIGLDYNGISSTLLSMQLFSSHLPDPGAYLLRDRTEQQLSFLARRDFLNQVLSVEGLLVHSLNDRDGYWHLYGNYRYRSDINVRVGVDTYYGDRQAVFGQFKDASRVSVGVEYTF